MKKQTKKTTEKTKAGWVPKLGEVYYVADPINPRLYLIRLNDGGSADNLYAKLGVACRTKTEAIRKSKFMIKAAKETK